MTSPRVSVPASLKTAISIYAHANSVGYPWRFGDGRVSLNGRTWLARFQKTNHHDDPDCAFIGYDGVTGEFVVEYSEVPVAR